MITLGSTELNYLILRYLVEEGYSHSAFVFGKESLVEESPHVPQLRPDAIKHYVTKGIEMEYVEKHTDEENRIRKCAGSYTITAPHRCVEEPLEVAPRYLQSQGSDVSVCAWGAEGELATGSKNCVLRLWGSSSGEVKGEWELGPNASASHGITAVAVGSRSSFGSAAAETAVVAATHAGDLFVSKGESVWRRREAHKGPIVAVTLDNHDLITGGWDGQCKRWTIENGGLKEAQKWALHKGPVMDLLKFDSGFVTCSGDGTLCTVSSDRGATKMLGHTGEVNSIRRVGELIASCSDDATVKLWRFGAPDPLHSFDGHSKEVYAIDAAGAIVASGSFDASVRLWDAERAAAVGALVGHKKAIYTVGFSPDGNLLASGGLDASIRFWDVRGREPVREFGVGAGIYQVAFSPSGSELAVCSSDSRPLILDLRR